MQKLAAAAQPDPSVTVINRLVRLVTRDQDCVVLVNGLPWHSFGADSEKDRRIAAASLAISGVARPKDVAAGFRIPRVTHYRDRLRMAEGGVSALVEATPGPKGPTKVTGGLKARARVLFSEEFSPAEIATRLGISSWTVRQLVKDLKAPPAEEMELPFPESAEPEGTRSTPTAGDERAETSDSPREEAEERREETDGVEPAPEPDRVAFEPRRKHPEATSEAHRDRSLDRAFARYGLLEEAEPIYVGGQNLANVGALMMVPALAGTGFFYGVDTVYGQLKPGFYGLRHTILTMALMLTLRLKRAEHLTGADPDSLGRLLGLDRAPEVKTFRRRLGEIAERGQAAALMQWFASELAKEDDGALGYLHVDGHVRPYFGERNLSKTYVTRLRVAMRATTDLWVNDANGSPLFVVTGSATSSLTKEFVPLLQDLRKTLPEGARPTLVFDRGGWSPKLFLKILGMGFDILTYRKNGGRRLPRSKFKKHVVKVDGEKRTMLLHDGIARLGRGVQLRCVTRLDDDREQVQVVTSKKDILPTEVIGRAGERWRQENFFKYAGSEFGLDALDTYRVELDDPERTVPNPERREFDVAIRKIRERIVDYEAQLGRAIDSNPEKQRRSARGFKSAHVSMRRKIATLRSEHDALVAYRAELPNRVAVGALPDTRLKLEVEHKHFTNIVRMAVCRAENSLARLLQPHYNRAQDDGRALLREAFRARGALRIENDVLHVTLEPLSAPRRTRAIAALCDELNEDPVRMPGTSLTLHFAVGDRHVS